MKSTFETVLKILIYLVAVSLFILVFKIKPEWRIVLLFAFNFSIIGAYVVMGNVHSIINFVIFFAAFAVVILKAIGADMPLTPYLIEAVVTITPFVMLRKIGNTNNYFLYTLNDALKENEAEYDNMLLEEKKIKTALESNLAKDEKYKKLSEIKREISGMKMFSEKARFLLRNIIYVFHKEKTIALFLLKDGKFMKVEANKNEDVFTGERDQESLFLKNFDEWVVSNRRSILIVDMQREMRFKAESGEDIRSLISVPVVIKDNVVGVIRITSINANCFTQEDLRFLDLIAEITGGILEEEEYA